MGPSAQNYPALPHTLFAWARRRAKTIQNVRIMYFSESIRILSELRQKPVTAIKREITMRKDT